MYCVLQGRVFIRSEKKSDSRWDWKTTCLGFNSVLRILVSSANLTFPKNVRQVVVVYLIVDSENKFTFFEIYVRVYDYGIFNRFTQTRA